jgi:hypothetical protein
MRDQNIIDRQTQLKGLNIAHLHHLKNQLEDAKTNSPNPLDISAIPPNNPQPKQ